VQVLLAINLIDVLFFTFFLNDSLDMKEWMSMTCNVNDMKCKQFDVEMMSIIGYFYGLLECNDALECIHLWYE